VKPISPAALVATLGLAASLPCGGAFAQAAVDQAASLSNPLAVQSLDALSATRERPLFAPSRRPPDPPAPAAPPSVVVASPTPPPEPPAITFYGVVMEPDGARALARGPSNESLRLRVGDEVGGWSVTGVDRRRLVLTLGERSETFSLFENKREKMAREPVGSVRQRIQTAPNTGHRYEGRAIPARPSQPGKNEPDL
jgi:general secretion pathway protein N